jgi:DNA repair protein RecN (Recombination protein N)
MVWFLSCFVVGSVIAKKIENRRTKTEIIELNKKARIKELAAMMGGEKITQVTIEHAKEMLKGI